jgi:hypothetical protein
MESDFAIEKWKWEMGGGWRVEGGGWRVRVASQR